MAKKTSSSILDAIRDIIKHKTKTRLETDTRTGPAPKPAAVAVPASSVKMDTKKNKQFLKDKKKLDAMSRSQIEALRAKLIAKRAAKKKKKTTPTF